MNIQLIRYSLDTKSTLGLMLIDGDFACYTLEDKARDKKLAGETCIPEGTYRISLRNEGAQNEKYKKKFPDMHLGMLHLCDVPNFNYIHIHVGNTISDTDGCILVGDKANNNAIIAGSIGDSSNAYKRIYLRIASAIAAGEQEVWISIRNGLSAASSPPIATATVVADHLNMRIAPNKEVLAVLKKGTNVSLLENNADWSKIQLEAWVAQEYLENE